jgi:lipopolysaccharide transport system ATP-binding protein
MSEIAVCAEGLSKSYRIGARQEGYHTLRDAMSNCVSRIARSMHRRKVSESQSGNGIEGIWALKDASFEIKRGEVVGIIGRNGAGKSTLLKILSRITEPTEGQAKIHGRVGSLLEVGIGFHPELTGRENIYLNGAILGMWKTEIDRKFDEIIAFAEIEKFIDTPVKHYSSGMYLRLAFSVAAHLEPEILIVDEVLSVGDSVFQQKCLGKMEDVAHEGRTVVLVSHNLEAVSVLTKRSLLLDKGRVVFSGDTSTALTRYRSMVSKLDDTNYVSEGDKTGVIKARVITSHPGQIHRWGQPLAFEFELHFKEKPKSAFFAFQVIDSQMRPIMNLWLSGTGRSWSRVGPVLLRCMIPKARIYLGTYAVTTYLGDSATKVLYETVQAICPFEVVMDGFHKEYPWERGDCTFIEDADWEYI